MRALGVLTLAVATFLLGLSTSVSFFYYLTYVLLGLLVVAYAWAWSNLEGLELERETGTHRAQVGEVARERLTIYNTWWIPKLWVEVRDHSDLPSHGTGFVSYLPRRSRRRWTIRTTCSQRGKWRLGPVSVHSGDPFGLFRLAKLVDLTSELIVYPATVEIPRFELPTAELLGGQDVKQRSFHVTPNVSTVRQYVPGDSFNRIHWRSTARTGQLMVKEFELDPSADVWIVLDMEERFHHALEPHSPQALAAFVRAHALTLLPATEEYAVTIAASLTRHLLRLNRNVGLLATGQHIEVYPPEREARQLYKILESLAMLHATSSMPLAELLAAESHRFGRTVSLIVITPSVDPRWLTGLQHMVYRGARAMVVFVEPTSFGGWRKTDETLARLAELRVPVYQIREGERIDHALATPLISSQRG